MHKIFYWSPFTTSKVATVRAVINSAASLSKFFKRDHFEISIIDAVHEWKDFEDEIKEKKINLIYLNKNSFLNSFKKDGFLRSRFAYFYIFFKSFFPLIKILQNKKPDYLIIHLITSLPLFLFILKKLDIKEIDLNLFKSITHGVLDNINSIDKLISDNLSSDWSFERLSVTEKTILRLATYELCFDRNFKKITIVNEYISIMTVFGGDPNFANAILEKISE